MVSEPRVFISYSQDSKEHVSRVRALADRLRRDGINCTIDQYEPDPPEGWPQWIDRQIEEADFVLIVCTPTYYQKASGQAPSGTGHGVVFEGVQIAQYLYDAAMRNEKFIPVLFEDLEPSKILRPLRPYSRYRVDHLEGYEELLRRLTDQPRVPRPELGPRPILRPEESPIPPADRPSGTMEPPAKDFWILFSEGAAA